PALTSTLFPYTALFRSIGNPLCPQSAFKGLGLVVTSIKDGIITVGGTMFKTMIHQFSNHFISLMELIPAGQHLHRIPFTQSAPRSEEHTSELQSRFDLV